VRSFKPCSQKSLEASRRASTRAYASLIAIRVRVTVAARVVSGTNIVFQLVEGLSRRIRGLVKIDTGRRRHDETSHLDGARLMDAAESRSM
jgi:hypothetical protein